MKKRILAISTLVLLILISACKKEEDEDPKNTPNDPNTAEKVAVDRFSMEAATLFVRDDNNGLPAANDPVNFDQAPFITQGLGPAGKTIKYYNFDVMPTTPAPIYVLFREGSDTPVQDQLNIVNVIPGDNGYNDFWHVHKVTVPLDYVPNIVSSYQEILTEGFMIEPTDILVNCPVVPEGSTASMRYGADESTALTRGWYNDKVVYYFNFAEKALSVNPNNPVVPLSGIMVTFNVNPGEPGGGPLSGFMTEDGTMQTHNVVQTLPPDAGYSPLWNVNVYDNADFDMVSDWTSANNANILATNVAKVNCPVVYVE